MRIALRILAVIVAILAIGGCGKSSSTSTNKAGQVVAKVNGDEITIHQVNFALSRMGAISEEQAKEASKQALNGLIDEELLVKKAVEMKLDRDPKITQAVESAKRQILSQAYVEKQVQGLGKPTASEVNDYYTKHPELFEKRRVFRFQELMFEARPETLKAVKTQLEQGKPLVELARWLQEQKIQFSANESVKPAEQFPLETLPRIQALKDGQIIVLPAGKAVVALQLVVSRDQPLSEEQAKPLIERYLSNKKRIESAQAEVKKLRDTSKIEYLGAFADAGKIAKPVESAKGAVAQQAAATDQGAAASVKADKDFLEKGLSGLK
jgi:EpsD family peptidyl-prolyl cis-trans isomerase